MNTIEYHVVAILSDTELIINAGKKDHISNDDYFDILEDEIEILKDPITNKIIDKVNRKKQRVYVTEIKQNYCICTSTYTKQVTSSNSLSSFIAGSSLLQETIGKKMKIDKKEINNIFSKFSYSTIHVGDKVELASK